MKATVRLLRNHPSLMLWGFGNELNPKAASPPSDIYEGILRILAADDPGRLFIASSMAPQNADFALFDPTYALAPQDGPYGLLFPAQWYNERNPGLAGYSDCPISFQPETGSASTPVYRSLRRFLSASALAAFPAYLSREVHPAWQYHKYLPYTSTTAAGRSYDHIYAYGEPNSTAEYAQQAQLVQFEQNRALFEGYRLHQWSYYTAVLMWKSQSPWCVLLPPS